MLKITTKSNIAALITVFISIKLDLGRCNS